MACCAGHDEQEYGLGYISFILNNERTKNIMLLLFSEILNLSGIEFVRFYASKTNNVAYSFYVSKGKQDETFEAVKKLLESIENEKKQVNPMVKTIHDTITGLKRGNIKAFEIIYNPRETTSKIRLESSTLEIDKEEEHRTPEEIISIMKEIQNYPGIFCGDKRSYLDNIYSYCLDQVGIAICNLLNAGMRIKRTIDPKGIEKNVKE